MNHSFYNSGSTSTAAKIGTALWEHLSERGFHLSLNGRKPELVLYVRMILRFSFNAIAQLLDVFLLDVRRSQCFD